MRKTEITAQLAEFIQKARFSDIPEHVIREAKELVTDFLGVTTAGAAEPPSRIVQSLVKEAGAVKEINGSGYSLAVHHHLGGLCKRRCGACPGFR